MLVVFAILNLLFLIVVMVVNFIILDNTSSSSSEVKEEGTEYLFTISSLAKQVITVAEVNTTTFNLTLPIPASFGAFTDIPNHKSYHIGHLDTMKLMFEASRDNPIDIGQLTDGAKEIVDKGLNLAETAFIEKRPNCTLSFTAISESTSDITHIETIAEMRALQVQDNNITITFKLLNGEVSVDPGGYEHVHVTVDSFWHHISKPIQQYGDSVGAVAGATACWGSTSVTLGASSAACGAATVVAISLVGDDIANLT
jgi:hypothetical protein